VLPVGPTAAITEVEEALMEQTSMAPPLGGNAGARERPPSYAIDVDGGPLGGSAGAWERPPPYAEDIDGDVGPPLEGLDPICCPNTHWYLQGVV
jgi:hypothetical protein